MSLIVDILWGYHVLALILLVGIKLSIDTKFFQIRKFFTWLKISTKKSKDGISSFQALSTALAGSIGTGNIVGVGLAVSVGGAGAIFWMWVSALFGMMTVFAEVSLSAKYKNSETVGAFNYIKRIGKGKILPYIYGVGCLLSSLAMGNMAQSNSFASASLSFGVPNFCTAIFLFVTLFVISSKGISVVTKLSEKIVPIMTVIFFFFSITALIICKENIPNAISEIFTEAFSLKAGAGAGIFLAMKTGISRGVFTNEAGLGSSSMAFSQVSDKSPKELGYLGIFQVFMDTTLMCTVTGLCIVCCTDLRQGDFLVRDAFRNAMGSWGVLGINICMLLFAFATMTATSYYGKVGLGYISKNRLNKLFPFLFAIAGFLGAVMPVSSVFEICDAFNGLMAIPNLLALSFYTKDVICIAKEK